MFRDTFNCIYYVKSLIRVSKDETDDNLEKAKQAADKCGAIGIKLLQFLVSNNGFLTPESRAKLSYVFEDNKVHDLGDTIEMYYQDFGEHMYDVFTATGDCVPVGSGTIGQVYKFYHNKLGVNVAVKVKHPGVDSEAMRFVKSLSTILYFVETVYTIPFAYLLKEYLANISLQLDYAREARATIKMRHDFESESHIIIPEIYEYSDRFIIMSYHEGEQFESVKDERLRKLISIDIYLFMMSCIMHSDLIHCDLHKGNWKVATQEDGTYKLVIYDFGLTSSLGPSMTKAVTLAMLSDNFFSIARVMVESWETQPKWQELATYIDSLEEKVLQVFTDKYEMILRKALQIGIPLNINVLRIMQGGNMCMNVVNLTRNNLNKVLGKRGNCEQVLLCYNLGLTEKTKKYNNLRKTILQWIEEDPSINTIYENWLEDTYGHKDGSIFVELTVDGLVF